MPVLLNETKVKKGYIPGGVIILQTRWAKRNKPQLTDLENGMLVLSQWGIYYRLENTLHFIPSKEVIR